MDVGKFATLSSFHFVCRCMFCTVIVILCSCFLDKIARHYTTKIKTSIFPPLLYRSPCVQILKRKRQTANTEVFFFYLHRISFFFPPSQHIQVCSYTPR
ncbi:Uncharacterized protein APZ42_033238 [Daphnia magna]|uniref:Uncharacterized protein n=1 Tax=Daphnia magna TaxID=35525 RepID=A0A164L908_9CRUS|nr:Uncharacterized protein APZ42_033238 [Daphnia magna]